MLTSRRAAWGTRPSRRPRAGGHGAGYEPVRRHPERALGRHAQGDGQEEPQRVPEDHRHASWRSEGAVCRHDLARRILEETGYRAELRKEDTAEADARLENLEELIGSIREYEEDAGQAGDTPSVSGYVERVSLVADVDGLKDAPAVTLMTVHGAKGLEFRTVLLTGMEEETFPYRGLDGQHDDELDEERRLAYVAITRARERLFVTHAASRTLSGGPSTSFRAGSSRTCRRRSCSAKGRRRPRGACAPIARSSPVGARAWDDDAPYDDAPRARLKPTPRRLAPAAPELAPGERVVDYDAFDDAAVRRHAGSTCAPARASSTSVSAKAS